MNADLRAIDDADLNPVHIAALPSPFALWRGGSLSDGVIAYECWGELNADASNAILLFTGLSPTAHAASSPANREPGWWEQMIGPGRAIDTDRHFVVCVNSLGSCFGSSGPASINPRTGLAWRLDFPEIAVEDIARAGWEVMVSLGVTQLAAVVGPSLGGIVALAFVAEGVRGALRIGGGRLVGVFRAPMGRAGHFGQSWQGLAPAMGSA